MEFLREEYWSGFLFPPPGYLPNPGIETSSPASPALAGGFFAIEPPGMNSKMGSQHLLTTDTLYSKAGKLHRAGESGILQLPWLNHHLESFLQQVHLHPLSCHLKTSSQANSFLSPSRPNVSYVPLIPLERCPILLAYTSLFLSSYLPSFLSIFWVLPGS